MKVSFSNMGWSVAGALLCLGLPLLTVSQAEDVVLASTSTVYVDVTKGDDTTGNGKQDKPYKTISHAIEVAPIDSTIQLASGTYSKDSGERFPLTLNHLKLLGDTSNRGKEIKIVGGGKYVSASFANQDITVFAGKESTVQGVTITNPNNRGYGIWVEDTSPTIERNSLINSLHDGLFITGDSMAKVIDNYFFKNISDGMTVADVSEPTIKNNVFESTGFGIDITGKSKPKLTGNVFRNNADGLILEGKSRAILRSNTIEKNRRSGINIMGEATADLGTIDEAGGNQFSNNGRTDVNNLTRPKAEIKAYGNKWNSPVLSGNVLAEEPVLADATKNAKASYQVYVLGKDASKINSLKKSLGISPVSKTYQGKSAILVGTYPREKAASLVSQLTEKGFTAVFVTTTTSATKKSTKK
jgi:parallel beta-helix repeat protein